MSQEQIETSASEREHRYYRSFLFYTSIAVFLIILAIFAGVVVRTRQLVFDQVLEQARAHFKNILVTRQWSLSHGGVYVEKLDWVKPNPFLENPEIKCADGRMLVFIPPAVMTKEISIEADKQGLFRYRITSLKPLNPANAPDDFERAALESFVKGKKEVYSVVHAGGVEHFRYMAPLEVDETCMACHAKQGYAIGDLRGGISVDIEIGELQSSLRRNMIFTLAAGALSVAVLLSLIYFFTAKLVERVELSRRKIEHLSITDDLTGINNRRQLMARLEEEYQEARRKGAPLSCVMVDIDFFKDFNDRFGHLVGDEILKDLARFIKSMVRAYDVFGRFGGEEFMVVLPATGIAEARAFAERIRQRVERDLFVEAGEEKVHVTISAGVAEFDPSDTAMTDIIRRADAAMYQAKHSGRNRIC